MDEFKKYLQEHKASLDADEPSPMVWNKIRMKQAPAKKTTTVVVITRWAAAACILTLAGIGIFSLLKQPEQPLQQNNTAQIQPKQPVLDQPIETIIEETPVTSSPLLANNNISTPKKNTERAVQTKTINPNQSAFNDLENSFKQVINLQRNRVSSTPMYAESADYFNDFKVEVRKLEKEEKIIKTAIVKQGMTDELLNQLITLYQQKLNTLKQLQIEMNKLNNRYKQQRGPVDSVKTYFIHI